MFIDTATISVKAGDGGNGAVSFRREKYVAAGGPDGGDGGRGGNVVFLVDDNQSTLVNFRYKRKYRAENGESGKAKRCYGKKGKDLVIKVPRGTLVKEQESGRIVADLSEDEPVIIAVGGRGGWGNSHFATSTRQVPRFAKAGHPGEDFTLTLELKLLADVCLAGYPSVGKSTLVSSVSAAKPKIAAYHFTTLSPVLGVVRIDEEQSFVMADIPGLIEGASEGAGLGHEFLRHLERCRLIVHIVDVSGSEGRDPREDFNKINAELENFSKELAARPQIVAANKCDIATEEQMVEFEDFIKEKGLDVFRISAATSEGTRELVYAAAQRLAALPPIKIYQAEIPDVETEVDRQRFEIKNENGVFVIQAEFLRGILGNVNMDDYESLQYFQRVLTRRGIINKLEEMGIDEGDTVRIFDFEFEYIR